MSHSHNDQLMYHMHDIGAIAFRGIISLWVGCVAVGYVWFLARFFLFCCHLSRVPCTFWGVCQMATLSCILSTCGTIASCLCTAFLGTLVHFLGCSIDGVGGVGACMGWCSAGQGLCSYVGFLFQCISSKIGWLKEGRSWKLSSNLMVSSSSSFLWLLELSLGGSSCGGLQAIPLLTVVLEELAFKGLSLMVASSTS